MARLKELRKDEYRIERRVRGCWRDFWRGKQTKLVFKINTPKILYGKKFFIHVIIAEEKK